MLRSETVINDVLYVAIVVRIICSLFSKSVFSIYFEFIAIYQYPRPASNCQKVVSGSEEAILGTVAEHVSMYSQRLRSSSMLSVLLSTARFNAKYCEPNPPDSLWKDLSDGNHHTFWIWFDAKILRATPQNFLHKHFSDWETPAIFEIRSSPKIFFWVSTPGVHGQNFIMKDFLGHGGDDCRFSDR
jgi:hypothetical protein